MSIEQSKSWLLISTVGTLCYTVLLTCVALTAPDAGGPTGTILSLAHPTIANVLHIPAYAVFAGLLMLSLRSLNVELRKAIVLTVLVSFLHGTLMEVFQTMIPGRCGSILDGILNLTGIGFIAISQFDSLHIRFMQLLSIRA